MAQLLQITVPYGSHQLTARIPNSWHVDTLPKITSSQAVITLDIKTIDLQNKHKVLILFTDATRHSPDQWLAEQILPHIPLPPEQVSFLCAVGMHRPSTYEEKVAKLGAAIVNTYTVIDHDPKTVIHIGDIDGIPIEINPLIADPDTFIIALGVVEPHQYAGYSGGAKTAVIGCSGANTIGHTHSPTMLTRNGVRLGAVENNPFQAFVRQAGQRIGIDKIANVVMVGDTILHAQFGDVMDRAKRSQMN